MIGSSADQGLAAAAAEQGGQYQTASTVHNAMHNHALSTHKLHRWGSFSILTNMHGLLQAMPV